MWLRTYVRQSVFLLSNCGGFFFIFSDCCCYCRWWCAYVIIMAKTMHICVFWLGLCVIFVVWDESRTKQSYKKLDRCGCDFGVRVILSCNFARSITKLNLLHTEQCAPCSKARVPNRIFHIRNDSAENTQNEYYINSIDRN